MVKTGQLTSFIITMANSIATENLLAFPLYFFIVHVASFNKRPYTQKKHSYALLSFSH